SQPSTGFEPYSHSRPCGAHMFLPPPAWSGHGDPAPPSALPPLLLPLPLPPLPPLPLPLLLLPLDPLLLVPPLPASLSVVNALPPHANDIRASGKTSTLPRNDFLM